MQDTYASRTGDQEQIISRVDPVVYGDVQPGVDFTLSQGELEQYRQNGFLVLPEYLTEIVDPLLNEIETLREKMDGQEELYTEPDSGKVRTIFKPFEYSDLVERVSRHPKMLRAVKQLLGSDVYLTQSRINVKPAFKGRSFPWHSDFETWHVEDGMPRMRAVTGWIILSENNEHNGPLYVIPGSHHDYVKCAGETSERNYLTSLKKQKLGVPRDETMDEILRQRSIQSIVGPPGTVVFHECNIMHGSPDNISDQQRSLLMFVYNSCENELDQPFSGLKPRPHYLRSNDCRPLQEARFHA